MIFIELILQNFGPYYGKHTINLNPTIDGNIRPIILFGGMNGGGKTTILDAIRLALYGQRAKCSNRGNLAYSQFLIQSINHQISSDDITMVELTFSHIINHQNIEFKITRQWSLDLIDLKDQLKIIENNTIHWPDDNIVNTWDEYIETILPLGISNLFLFDGEQVKLLAEEDTLNPSIVQSIKSLLGIELTSILSNHLGVLLQRKRKALANSIQLVKLEEIEDKIKTLDQEKHLAEKEMNSLFQGQQQALINRDKIREKFFLQGGKIASEKSGHIHKLENLKQSENALLSDLRTLAAGILPLTLISPLLKQASIQGLKEVKSQQAQMALKIMQSRDRKLLKFLDLISFDQKKIDQVDHFLKQENQNLVDKASLQSLWLSIDPKTLNQLQKLLNQRLPKQQQILQDKFKELQQIKKHIEQTEEDIDLSYSPKAYNLLEQQLLDATQKFANLDKSYLEAKKTFNSIERLFNDSKKELDSYSQEILDRQNNQHTINTIHKLQAKFKQFKDKLVLKKISDLEEAVTHKFRYLLHKSDLVNRISIDINNFEIEIYDFNGKLIPKHRLSAGEKQLLAISFLWGLAEVSASQLPIIIDTPLARLDSSHRLNLVQRYFPLASHQVILLSTDTEIEQLEVEQLRQLDAISREYLLKYDNKKSQTTILNGYFW